MAKLGQLFDMYRIAGNSSLDEVIEKTHSRYGNIVELDDDQLELAAAGMGGNNNDSLKRVCCKRCQDVFMVSINATNVICPTCKKPI